MASTAKELEQALLDRSRNKIVIGFMMILSCPSYDPTVEGPALLKIVDEVAKTGALAMLGLGVNLFGTSTTGIQTDRNLDEELRTLIRTLFPLGFDVDGQEDPPGDIYAEAAKGVYDAPLNEGDRVTGKPEALGAGYGIPPEDVDVDAYLAASTAQPYTFDDETTELIRALEEAEGRELTFEERFEVGVLLKTAITSSMPQVFLPKGSKGGYLVMARKDMPKTGEVSKQRELATLLATMLAKRS